MSLLKLWFIRNPVLVSYIICLRQGISNLSGSQSALTCLCVCARAQLGLREFNKASVQDTKAAKAALERSLGIISLNCREGFACLDGLSV
jgi:hypothetical protein